MSKKIILGKGLEFIGGGFSFTKSPIVKNNINYKDLKIKKGKFKGITIGELEIYTGIIL